MKVNPYLTCSYYLGASVLVFFSILHLSLFRSGQNSYRIRGLLGNNQLISKHQFNQDMIYIPEYGNMRHHIIT